MLINADALHIPLADGSVHCVVTSPPYFGLRDYGVDGQLAGGIQDSDRWDKIQAIAANFGGTATRTINGNKMDIRVYGKLLVALLDELVSGHTAKDKCFAPVVWRYSDLFVEKMLEGYLSGDGHWDDKNHRWRLGFTRNYNLERDLRAACARLGWKLSLKLSYVRYNGQSVPTFRGEIRRMRSKHPNAKSDTEVIKIRKSRCRFVYDLGVADEPHLFALASGILTHNSKPNPMPESVTDRPTTAHEYVFLLTKTAKYFYDADAVREQCTGNAHNRGNGMDGGDSDVMNLPLFATTNPKGKVEA